MEFKAILITSRSMTLELVNNSIVETDNYKLFVNDKLYKEDNKNIISIFNLTPKTAYKLELVQNGVSFVDTIETKDESVSLNVKLFGAKGDGVTLDTNAIEACILACPDNGRVFIPEGDYLTGPLFLRSNITIELEKGARLLGDTDRNHYPILPGMVYITAVTM